MLKKLFNLMIEKGQSLVFFAVSVPVLFMITGAVADFGWLYFHQSRLQNAADAAVVAGAQKFVEKIDEGEFSEYYDTKLVANTDEGLAKLVKNNVISTKDTSLGDEEAIKWIKYNLDTGHPDFKVFDISPPAGSSGENDTVEPAWNTVKFKHMLYGGDGQDYNTLYYVVTISEQLDHLFDCLNFLPNLQAKAFSVVQITQYKQVVDIDHGPNLYDIMTEIRNKEVYADWWKIENEYEFKQGQSHDTAMMTARKRSVQAKGNEYAVTDRNGNNNYYRTETLTLHGWSKATKGNGVTYGDPMDQRNLDDLFIDLKVDRNDSGFKDSDKGSNQTNYNLTLNGKSILGTTDKTTATEFSNGLTGDDVFNFRIHDLINVGKWNAAQLKYEYVYKVREGKNYPDPLYVHIESEDNYVDGSGANTVRQMIINFNASNTTNNDRPMFFFYEGPQKYYAKDGKSLSKKQTTWEEDWRETWKHLGYTGNDKYDSKYVGHNRNSLPVIINFFADFNCVIFMPNSPVVINGNGHEFKGFVVAEKFLRLKNDTDFISESKVEKLDKFYTIKKETDKYTSKDGKKNYNEYYVDDDGYVLYHTMAEGGTKYVQYTHKINYLGIPTPSYHNVIYAQGNFQEIPYSEIEDVDVTLEDKIYVLETDEGNRYFKIDANYIKINESDPYYIKVKPNAFKYREDNNNYVKIDADYYEEYEFADGQFKLKRDDNGNTITDYILSQDVQIKSSDSFVLYTYTLIKEEKSNLLSDFKDNEKEYVELYPMYVDEFGNVLYAKLSGDCTYSTRPKPLDTTWHSNYNQGSSYNLNDDLYEVIYKPSTFNLRKVTYDSFNKFLLGDYTNLNGQDINDVFYTTIRSTWID